MPSSYVNRRITEAYDADAEAYFKRCGVLSGLGRWQVTNFVRGLKSLGLWSDIVCYPMRSYQNAGSGSTVYALTPLTGYPDLSLVGSITWGRDGLVSTGAAGSEISSTSFPDSRTGTIALVTNVTVAGTSMILSNTIRANGTLARVTHDGTNAGTSTIPASSSLILLTTNGGFYLATASRTSTSFQGTSNVSTYQIGSATTAIPNPVQKFTLANREATDQPTAGTYAFAAYAQGIWTQAQQNAFYYLYQRTLAPGFTMP